MNTTFWLAIDRIPLAHRRRRLVHRPDRRRRLAQPHPPPRARSRARGARRARARPPGLRRRRSRRPRARVRQRAHVGALHLAVRRLTGEWSPLSALVAGTIVGSLLLVPGAAATGGLPVRPCRANSPSSPRSARSAPGLPYLVELFVMQRVTTRAFSVLQALYPAAGVAVGVIGLGQSCGPIELGGVVLVTSRACWRWRAAATATRSGRDGDLRRLAAPQDGARRESASTEQRTEHDPGVPRDRRRHDQDARRRPRRRVASMIAFRLMPVGSSGGGALIPGG